ncbi:MAG: hypothetical protein RL112_278 [Planctomycetota bacterium]|jgi:hypothetical protein
MKTRLRAPIAAGLLAALCTACDTSKDFAPIGGGDSSAAPVAGSWIVGLREIEPGCGAGLVGGPGGELVLNIVQDGSDATVYVDADGDGDFSELVQLQATVGATRVRASGSWTQGDQVVGLELDLRYIVWGSMSGVADLSHAPADPQPGAAACESRHAATVIKIGNPPQFDLGGAWTTTQRVAFASGPLQALTGSTEALEWSIAQSADPARRGVFKVDSSDGRGYLGVVNDSQVIVGGSFELNGFPASVTYSTLNYHPNESKLAGQLLADYGPEGEYSIGWDVVALRAEEPALLVVASAGGGRFLVLGADGRRVELALAPGETARVELPEGPAMVRTRTSDLPLRLAAGDERTIQLD